MCKIEKVSVLGIYFIRCPALVMFASVIFAVLTITFIYSIFKSVKYKLHFKRVDSKKNRCS